MSYEIALTVTAALAAMSCAMPGLWLVLRRHSLMGDALAHSALLGVVGAFLASHLFRKAGLISPDGFHTVLDVAYLLGAVVVGVCTAYLTEALNRVARVEPQAALGVVFSTMFALGLFLVRFAADDTDLDVECVLFGIMETTVAWDTLAGTSIPTAAAISGGLLVINGILTAVFYKELKLSSFDADFAQTQGLPAGVMHYALMTATALTVVAAFKTVGSILVVGLLVVPGATAILLSQSLVVIVWLTLAVAAISAVLARVLCWTVPSSLFAGWGVQDVSTAGMMGVASGVLFVAAWLFSRNGGLITSGLRRLSQTVDFAAEDLLGVLYRLEEREQRPSRRVVGDVVGRRYDAGRALMSLAARRLRSRGHLLLAGDDWQLTTPGREAAAKLVRKHRLWEAYLAKHFQLPDDHLHAAAHQAEHYIGEPIERDLVKELDQPDVDPHGREIPE